MEEEHCQLHSKLRMNGEQLNSERLISKYSQQIPQKVISINYHILNKKSNKQNKQANFSDWSEQTLSKGAWEVTITEFGKTLPLNVRGCTRKIPLCDSTPR